MNEQMKAWIGLNKVHVEDHELILTTQTEKALLTQGKLL